MSEVIVEAKDVVKRYNGNTVLDGVSLTICEQEHVSLLGENSSGKTTLLKVLLGIIPYDSGRIFLMGEDIKKIGHGRWQWIMSQVSMQFQYGALFDSMAVGENIRFPMDEKTNFPRQKKEDILVSLLRKIGMEEDRNKYPYDLSGGMKKRVAIARALASYPRLCLFDEPAAGLDPVTSVHIIHLIKEMVGESRMTMLVATISVLVGISFSERFLILKDGKIVADGPWQELLKGRDPWVSGFIARGLPGAYPSTSKS